MSQYLLNVRTITLKSCSTYFVCLRSFCVGRPSWYFNTVPVMDTNTVSFRHTFLIMVENRVRYLVGMICSICTAGSSVVIYNGYRNGQCFACLAGLWTYSSTTVSVQKLWWKTNKVVLSSTLDQSDFLMCKSTASAFDDIHVVTFVFLCPPHGCQY